MRFSNDLIGWYKKNKRDLPWRKSTDAYTIWLSEIILQQTRVDQGLDYFNKFLDKYPTVNNLAQAKEDEVLKLWQGLGYYSRARNLHYTAKFIVNNYNGVFPKDYKEILTLKGIGGYTAAAIASFAFNKPYPVVDGNVYRVLSRIFGIEAPIDSGSGKKIFKNLAEKLIDKRNPAIYNQAIMEFGALNCTPKKPNCESCIFNLECHALKNNIINQLPKKEKKLKHKNRYFNYLIISDNNSIYIKQRIANDIWKGLYDFPLIESSTEIKTVSEISKNITELRLNIPINIKYQSESIIHILSHQKIHTHFWHLELNKAENISSDFMKIDLKEINNYPVPKLIENYIKTML